MRLWLGRLPHQGAGVLALSRYAKAVVAVLVAGLTAVQSAITDDVITKQEWVTIGLVALGAVGVLTVRNAPPADPPGRHVRAP